MRRRAIAFACTVALSGPALGAAGDALTVIGDRVNVRAGPGTERAVRMQVSRNQPLVELERQGEWVHAEIAGTGGSRGWIHASLVAGGGESPIPPAGRARQPEPAGAPSRATSPAPAAGPGEPPSLRPSEEASDAAAAEPEAGAGGAAALPGPAGAPTSGPEATAPGAAELEAADLQRFRDSVAYLNSRSKSIAGVDLFTQVEPLGGGTVQVGATAAWADIPPAGQRSYVNALIERWAAATGRPDQLTVRIVDQRGQVIMEQSRP